MSETRSDSLVRIAGDVIIKQHRVEADPTRSPGVRARHEFETLTRLREVLPEAFTVPRAMELAEADGTLTMQRAPGTPLDQSIREHKRDRDAVESLAGDLRRTGAWLRTMQEATRDLVDAAHPADPATNARAVLAAQTALAIRDAEMVLGGRLQRRVVARIRELQSRVAQQVLTTCGHHGDYWPGNVFVDPARVTVIDFEGYRRGLPLEDVAYFLIELELLLPRQQRILPALRVAFLDGYGGVDRPEALALFTLTKTLRLMALGGFAKHRILVALWIRFTLRRIVGRCLPA